MSPDAPEARVAAATPTRRVVLVGPPGSGKSTQGTRLARRLGVRHLSTGDVLRDEVRRGSPIGRRADTFMREGALVPDWLLLLALEHRLSKALAHGFVLDGYPRTVEQAHLFTRSLGSSSLAVALELAVPDEVVMQRLAARAVCGRCGQPASSANTAACARCGGEVELRLDDDETVVRARLATYRTQTEPMLALFASQGRLVTVDGSADAATVASEITRLVG
jgi:adenylate kinase